MIPGFWCPHRPGSVKPHFRAPYCHAFAPILMPTRHHGRPIVRLLPGTARRHNGYSFVMSPLPAFAHEKVLSSTVERLRVVSSRNNNAEGAIAVALI
jgi:hypothetical protein